MHPHIHVCGPENEPFQNKKTGEDFFKGLQMKVYDKDTNIMKENDLQQI